jgi:hypothetical protein
MASGRTAAVPDNSAPFPGRNVCINCSKPRVEIIDPLSHTVFRARKGYYRSSTEEAISAVHTAPMAMIAAEHTAQLNMAQEKDVFSKAERMNFYSKTLILEWTKEP